MEKINITHDDSRSLRTKVFNEIEHAILTEAFTPGDSLIEMKLADDLGVSRTPVREALRLLEVEGLVRTVPNKGAVVIGVSDKDIDDIYTIRIHIEGLAAFWAAENISPEELAALRSVADLQEFYAGKDDPSQVWKLDSDFHGIIYDASRSKPLNYMLSNFHHYIQKARERSIKSAGRAAISVAEHRGILNALTAHDPALAQSLSEKHIANAHASVIQNRDLNLSES